MPAAMATKQARELVEPINERLGRWQFLAAKLRGQVDRPYGSRAAAPEIAELSAEIEEQRRNFELLVGSIDPVLAAHVRVTDTRRALANLATAVTKLRTKSSLHPTDQPGARSETTASRW